MTVQELQSYSDSAPRWTEACPVGHRETGAADRGLRTAETVVRQTVAVTGSHNRPPTRSERGRSTDPGTPNRARPRGGHQVAATPSGETVPGVYGRRVLPRPPVTARACHVEAPVVGGVVDDVPTWVLLTSGVLVGVLMLLAVAFLGGPAYA